MSVKDWEHARHPDDKFGPMPGGVRMSPGRGPHGEIRNFKAMHQKKLAHTLRMLAIHGEDHNAHMAAMAAAADKLGVKFDGNTIKVPQHLVEGATELQEFWSEAARMRSAEVRREKAQLRKAGMSAGGMASPGTIPDPGADLRTPSVLGGMAAVGQQIRTLGRGKSFSYHLPEGQVTATHTGFGTYHVAGGGHNVDPMVRRGDRKISGAGAARREVAERIRSSYAADRAHTDQAVQDAMRHGQTRLTPIGGGQAATVRKAGQGWVVEHPSLPEPQTFGSAHEAVRAGKAAVRAGGGRFLRTGEDIDPLHSDPGTLPMRAHLTLARKEAAMDGFEKNLGDKPWAQGEISSPRDWVKDHALEKASDAVTLPGFSDGGSTVPRPAFHQAVSGLVQSHAALMAPHMAAVHAVVSHPAFAHAAHTVTQVVQARADTAERDLAEAEASGDTRRIVAARARANAARRHVTEAQKQLNAAR